MRWGWLAPGVAVLVTLAGAGCAGSSGPKAAPAPAVHTVSLTERQIARFDLPGQPDWLAADSRYLYVKEDSGDVVAIDPTVNRIAWRVTTSSGLCQGLGVGFGSVWSCAPSDTDGVDDVVRIDPRTHRVTGTFKVGKSTRQGRLVTSHGRVWFITSTPGGSSLVGIDPATGKTDTPIPLGMLAVELAGDGGLIWAVGSVSGQVVGVDLQQHKVVRRVDGLAGLGGPSLLTVGDSDLLWVSGESATAGIDRTSGRVRVRVPQGAKGYGGLVSTKTDLWLHSGDPFLTRIDPSTGRTIERIVAPDLPNPGDVLVAFGSLWASANNQATLVRVSLPG